MLAEIFQLFLQGFRQRVELGLRQSLDNQPGEVDHFAHVMHRARSCRLFPKHPETYSVLYCVAILRAVFTNWVQ